MVPDNLQLLLDRNKININEAPGLLTRFFDLDQLPYALKLKRFRYNVESWSQSTGYFKEFMKFAKEYFFDYLGCDHEVFPSYNYLTLDFQCFWELLDWILRSGQSF